MNKILLIGCGHMGTALLKAWSKKTNNKFIVVDPIQYKTINKHNQVSPKQLAFDNMSEPTGITFLCPFNNYHKQFDRRKFLFHIARCKDRRGKTVYSCQYSSEHIYISIDKLIDHEKNE